MHQDVLSSRVQSYDGIPAWLYDKFPAPAHAYPWPLNSAPPVGDWFFGYITEACSHGFQCLYDNVSGAVESMSKFWRLVAKTFGGYSNVLGYELINEPWAGNYIANPFLILPGIAGSTNLQPLYDKLAKAIRSVDKKTLIFYEPVTWGVRLNGKYVGTGFTHVPGGDSYRDRSVLSYHYYCIVLSLDPVPGNGTIPIFERVLCDDIEGPAVFESVRVDLLRLGGSAFLTEFGGCDDSPTCDEQLRWALGAADEFYQSWAYWGAVRDQKTTIDRLARVLTFDAFDINKDGTVSFDEFLIAYSAARNGNLDDRLDLVFRVYDISDDGFIDEEELTKLIVALYDLVGKTNRKGDHDPKRRAAQIMAKLDANGDKKLTKAEFVSGCKADPFLRRLLDPNS
ncbi:unnamed protein product [Rotaria sp. Silwood1]|nr:unnamed protein product [Rotaria sp. Silwood1]CAF1610596.1 unnamed protein product [Rotaria sp. Silwood1]